VTYVAAGGLIYTEFSIKSNWQEVCGGWGHCTNINNEEYIYSNKATRIYRGGNGLESKSNGEV